MFHPALVLKMASKIRARMNVHCTLIAHFAALSSMRARQCARNCTGHCAFTDALALSSFLCLWLHHWYCIKGWLSLFLIGFLSTFVTSFKVGWHFVRFHSAFNSKSDVFRGEHIKKGQDYTSMLLQQKPCILHGMKKYKVKDVLKVHSCWWL